MPRAVIAGAGVFGASLAHRLAGEGWDVVLVEPWEPGHARAASGGESRLLRCAHGADVAHTRSARRARELWRAPAAGTRGGGVVGGGGGGGGPRGGGGGGGGRRGRPPRG